MGPPSRIGHSSSSLSPPYEGTTKHQQPPVHPHPHPLGEGVPLRVEPTDPSQRTLAFGAVPRGQSSSRQLAVTNRGKAAALLSLAPARELLERLGVEVMPAAPVVLRPREETSLTLFFR